MRLRGQRNAVFAILFLALLGSVTLSRGQLKADTPPHRFSGIAFLNGVVAADATITGIINEVNCGTTTADASGQFRLDVLSAEDRLGCGINGVLVRFTINGVNAAEMRIWELGQFTPVNLYAPTTGVPDTFTVSGLATISGQAAANTVIGGLVNGVLCGSTITDALGNFRLVIAGTTIRSGCGTPSATVTFTVGGQTALQTAGFVSGGQQSLNLSAGVGVWLSGPPSSGQPLCPTAGNWLFLYWGGAHATPIAAAIAACPGADRFWTNRQGQWLAFSPGSPANDTWDVRAGEGHFVRGGP